MQEMVNIYVYGKKYSVPGDLTIMTAMEYAGYQLKRGCGCRHGFCGACATIYRIKGKNELKTCLACQTQVEDGIDLLHTELYDILGETIRVCQKHDIPYFVIGGTAIGALYDQGILPWDDDIDIGMTRENYNKFLKVAPGELGPSYFLSWIETDPHTPYYYAKVKKNNTLFVEEMFKNVPMHPGIFVDIFPFDRIPDNKLLRQMQSGILGFLKCCLMGKEIWALDENNGTRSIFLPEKPFKEADAILQLYAVMEVLKELAGSSKDLGLQ